MTDNEQFVVYGPRPDGFTILYNDAAEILIPEHNTVKNCYLAMCLFSNGHRSTKLGLKTLGEKMGSMDEQTARRARNRLIKIGLLESRTPPNQGRGNPNVYILTTPKKGIKQTEKGYQTDGERVSNYACARGSNYQLSSQVNPLSIPPRGNGGSNDVHGRESANPSQGSSTGNQTIRGALSSDLHEGLGVSNSLDEWWTKDEGKMLGVFRHIWKEWPRQSGIEEAMGQFRVVFTPEIERDAMFVNRLWHIVQWQIRQWEKEDREPKYVPSLANWIKRGQWRDAPEVIA